MIALIFDAEVSTLTPERFALLAARYWVPVFRRTDAEPARPWEWLFGISEPKPMPNPDMYWRRPTYSEAMERQARFASDPKGFGSLALQYSERAHKWRRR